MNRRVDICLFASYINEIIKLAKYLSRFLRNATFCIGMNSMCKGDIRGRWSNIKIKVTYVRTSPFKYLPSAIRICERLYSIFVGSTAVTKSFSKKNLFD